MTNGTPLVSIAMPNYNNEKFLPETIESIQRQTLDDYELVIYHDPSEDNSLQVLQEFSSKDQRINLILGKEKINPAHGYNMAIDNACGKYIFIMDSDNIMEPELLQKSVDFMAAKPETTMLSSDYKYFGKSEPTIAFPASHDRIAAGLLLSHCSFGNAMMVRREFFDHTGLRYDESFTILCDCKLFVDALLQNEYPTRFSKMDYTGIRYRIHDSNISSSKRKACEEWLAICDNVSEKLYPQDRDYELLRNVQQYNMNHYFMRFYDCGINAGHVTLKNMLRWRDATVAGLGKYQALDNDLLRAELNKGIIRMAWKRLKSLVHRGYYVRQSLGDAA